MSSSHGISTVATPIAKGAGLSMWPVAVHPTPRIRASQVMPLDDNDITEPCHDSIKAALMPLAWPKTAAVAATSAALTLRVVNKEAVVARCQALITLIGPEAAAAAVIKYPQILKSKASTLATNYAALQPLATTETLQKVIKYRPHILQVSPATFRAHVTQFGAMAQVPEPRATSLLLRTPQLLSCDANRIYHPAVLAQLQALFHSSEQADVVQFVRKWPMVLSLSMDSISNKVQQVTEVITSAGLPIDSSKALRLLLQQPWLLGYDPASLTPKLAVLAAFAAVAPAWRDQLAALPPHSWGHLLMSSVALITARLSFMLDVHGCHDTATAAGHPNIRSCLSHDGYMTGRYPGYAAWRAVWQAAGSPSILQRMSSSDEHSSTDSSSSSKGSSRTAGSNVAAADLHNAAVDDQSIASETDIASVDHNDNAWWHDYITLRDTYGGRVLQQVCTSCAEAGLLQRYHTAGQVPHLSLLEACGMDSAMLMQLASKA
eukprot:jgi/Chrzof1/3503/Cz12g27240.t1